MQKYPRNIYTLTQQTTLKFYCIAVLVTYIKLEQGR
nr:MAG TPA: hypothetical protein [Caudoviricetes sp.]